MKKVMDVVNVLLVIVSSFLLTSCFMSASITDLNPQASENINVVMKNKIRGGEFVAGSGEYEFTQLRRYKIKSAAGMYYSKVVQKTPRGYKIYNSLQGNLLNHEK